MGTPTGPRVPWTVGTWESRGLLMVPLGLWDGKDSGTVVALVGHGSPEDFPWSPWDFGMGRTVGLWWPWWDMGIPRTLGCPDRIPG